MSHKELAMLKNKERMVQGHRTCPGCAIPIIVRTALSVIDKPVVMVNATGCMEVTSTVYPFTSWNIPYMHNAFENTSATISGIETAYRVLKRKGIIKDDTVFIAFGGDGGTYDIGLQSLSGALERGHDFLYICYDNEGYMNTGDQRSGATPIGAKTSTTPFGNSIDDFERIKLRKNLTKIIAAHNIPYVAQASIAYLDDFANKVKKAISIKGPKFINVLSACTRYWGISQSDTVEVSRLATNTNFWPVYEVEDYGKKYTVNIKPKKQPISDWINFQKRFKSLSVPENKHIVELLQKTIDEEFEYLLKLEKL